jgi:hypothetical protein
MSEGVVCGKALDVDRIAASTANATTAIRLHVFKYIFDYRLVMLAIIHERPRSGPEE